MGDETRALLLDAAEALFGEKGYPGVSVREIGAQAQTNCSLINYHFGGKAGLYEAVIERRMTEGRRIMENAEAMVEAAEGGAVTRNLIRVTLRGLLTGFTRHMCQRPAFMKLMTREVGEGFPVASKVVQRLMPIAPLARLLARAQEEGVIRNDVPALQLTAIVFGVHQHFMATAPMLKEIAGIDIHDPDQLNQIVNTNLNVLLDGMWSQDEA